MADADRALGADQHHRCDGWRELSQHHWLQRVVVSNEESLSQRQDKLESEVDVGAASWLKGALAGDERDRENRKARGVILNSRARWRINRRRKPGLLSN